MTNDEYLTWTEARAGVPRHPVVEPPRDDTPVETSWSGGALRCDPHRCDTVCCTKWPAHRGVRLEVADLVRFQAAGLLDSVEGAFAADPPDQPRLRSIDGDCVHYDTAQRRCTIYEHRPLVCRTFPYALAWAAEDGSVGMTFERRCSLTPDVSPAALSEHAVKPRRYLTLHSAKPGRPARELHPSERFHLAACIESVNEHERTHRLVTQQPEALAHLGLAAFAAGNESGG